MNCIHLVPKLRQFFKGRGGVCEGLLAKLDGSQLALMEGLGLDLPLLLQTIHHILVTPANLMRQTLHCAVLPARLQSQYSKRLRNDHSLLSVIRRGNTLKEFEAFKGCRAASSLVGDHAADGPVENLRRSAVMERT